MDDYLKAKITYKSDQDTFIVGFYKQDESIGEFSDQNFQTLEITDIERNSLRIKNADYFLRIGDTIRIPLRFNKKLGVGYRIARGVNGMYSFILKFNNSEVQLFVYRIVGKKYFRLIIEEFKKGNFQIVW